MRASERSIHVETVARVYSSRLSGGAIYANPGTDGVGGAGDGFMSVISGANEKLATNSFSSPCAGNWNAAGIQSVRFWLNDIGLGQPLEVSTTVERASLPVRIEFARTGPRAE